VRSRRKGAGTLSRKAGRHWSNAILRTRPVTPYHGYTDTHRNSHRHTHRNSHRHSRCSNEARSWVQGRLHGAQAMSARRASRQHPYRPQPGGATREEGRHSTLRTQHVQHRTSAHLPPEQSRRQWTPRTSIHCRQPPADIAAKAIGCRETNISTRHPNSMSSHTQPYPQLTRPISDNRSPLEA
jgi:hypothetical protein